MPVDALGVGTDRHGTWYRKNGEVVLKGREDCGCRGRGYYADDMMGESFHPCETCSTYQQVGHLVSRRKGGAA